MTSSKPTLTARALAGLLAVCCLLLVTASTASAHDPIFLTDDQTTPDTGPYMPDGSISWALYGTVLADGDTRGFEFDLRDGDDLVVSLLIPNLSPELELSDDELPVVDLELPDGTTMQIVPNMREVFDEPFSNTSYVTLAEVNEPGMAGRYRGVLTGGAPARWSVAIGINEIFFTETERSGDRPTNFMEISAPLGVWYSTLPGEEPNLDGPAEGEAVIQMDLIEEAMGSGQADAPDSAIQATTDEPAEQAAAPENVAEAVAEDSSDTAAVADSQASEVLASTVEDSGSGLTWIAPVAIGVLALAGAFAYTRRSN